MAEPLPQVQWYAKPTWGYAKESNEAFNNAAMIYSILSNKGWTLNAIAGALGNIQHEGIMNPWSWENSEILASTDTYLIDNSYTHGYGLFGFTPSGHYLHSQYAQSFNTFAPNYSDIPGNPNDGDAQIRYMDEYYIDEWQGWRNRNSNYYMPWEDYKVSALTPSYLAGVWMYSFEGPADPTGQLPLRETDAEYYYNLLLPYDPNPPTPPPTPTRKSMPLWMMLRKRF